MTTEEREQALIMIQAFWEDKRDPTRWTGWEEAKIEFPEIVVAWENYLAAERQMCRIVYYEH